MSKIVCFDLEGPLSPQDNAFEVMGLLDNGKNVFEKISRFDDIISLEGREGYEPGDTLSLIAPFLVAGGLNEENVREISDKAKIVDGSKELVEELREDGWSVYIISTSYKYHAYTIGEKLGVPPEDIWCTDIDFKELEQKFSSGLKKQINNFMIHILEIEDEELLVEELENFFFDELPKTDYGNPLERVRVVGGAKKLEAVKKISNKHKVPISEIAVVGDSITDYKMLGEVSNSDGKSIVFNGNEYAVPHARYAVGADNIRYISPILNSEDPDNVVKQWEENQSEIKKDHDAAPASFSRILKQVDGAIPDIRLVREEEIQDIVKSHVKFRKAVRGDAAELG
ncbi:HAD family hydrolase [Methanonatronarchaeum sp. AMET6-2]|uniref:HAD family hydrolase n=1 Tax=Methanonatronarchaeum sp. AMET6-2 TaxID=2933293 RepID=UPI001217EA65|nr:HAD family hydrolase [Methanonatronarchaeum sp. AMET6-2]RZN63360.1 MAG: hypothetical protein EF811_00480 [Methanonatronarchaeia archaeon]UOY10579.1 HAD hydrolase family protein [Methanonatronarchaeum sp. AMET6-2]